MKRFLTITLLSYSLLLVSLESLFASNLDVVFRFDDYRLVKDSLQNELVETFARNCVPITLAVVPYDYNGNVVCSDTVGISRLNVLASEGLVEIAMHGNSHAKRTANGEFEGLAADVQRQLLTSSYQVLDSLFDISPISFIPPWNNYDSTTLDILEALGVKTISSCMTIGQSLDNKNVAYYPCTVGTDDAFPSFRSALEVNHHRKGLLVFMFHSYDFNERFSMEDLDELLKEVKTMGDVRCVTFRTLWEDGIESDSKRFKANLEVNLLTKLLGVNTIMQPTITAVARRIVNLLAYLIVAVLTLFLSLVIVRKRTARKVTCRLHSVAYLCMAFVLFGCVWLHWWSPLKSLALAIALPILYAVLQFAAFQKDANK